jgi:hypothetical protein
MREMDAPESTGGRGHSSRLRSPSKCLPLRFARVAEVRITAMPIAEIINEIDAYLSRLLQARELLLDRMTEAPQKRVPRRKRTVIVRQVAPGSSSGRRTDENKPRSNHPVAHLKEVAKCIDTSPQIPRTVVHGASDSEKPAMIEPERAIPQSVVVRRLPAKEPRTSIRSLRYRTGKPVLGTQLNKIKPPIALAGSMSSRVVVVSAEQVQREREQAAQPAIRRPRTLSSGLSGRMAFEALFKDETDPSKASGQ